MELWNRLNNQIREWFTAQTPETRILVLLLAAGMVFGLGWLLFGHHGPHGVQSGKYSCLYEDRQFNSDEKRSVEDALSQENLNDFEWVNDRLQVPSKFAARYRVAISSRRAVADRGNARQTTAESLKFWDSNKMIDERKIQAYAKDVAASIAINPEIASVTVIPNQKSTYDDNLLGRKQIKTVSVNVETRGFKSLSENAVAAIANIVGPAFGIEDYKEIRIVDSRNSRSYNGFGEELTGGGASVYLKEQARYQEIWKNTIQEHFHYIRGLQVQTSVKLTDYLNKSESEIRQEVPQAPLYERVHEAERFQDDSMQPNRMAMMSRPLAQKTPGKEDEPGMKERTREKEVRNPKVGVERRFESVPFVPVRILASLQIPRDYVRDSWREKNDRTGQPTPEQYAVEEKLVREEIRRVVSKLLEPYCSEKPQGTQDLVEVTFYNVPKELETVFHTEAKGEPKLPVWIRTHWQTFAAAGFVLFGLCFLWSSLKSVRVVPESIVEEDEDESEELFEPFDSNDFDDAMQDDFIVDAREEPQQVATESSRSREIDPFDKSIQTLQNEISALVVKNPEAAVDVLRRWIGDRKEATLEQFTRNG